MKQLIDIVLGVAYGDEGKGLATDFLASKGGLVVRFNGGPQAGHTVTRPDGRSHVFSHFGAATIKGVPTFWSRYCPVSPQGFLREREILLTKFPDLNPVLFVDPLCPVITPWDMAWNQWQEQARGHLKHGSCGIGFGTTVARHENTPFKLYASDLYNPVFLEKKLIEIWKYYRRLADNNSHLSALTDYGRNWRKPVDKFLEDAAQFAKYTILCNERSALLEVDHIVFEGAQGILLDQNHGNFPHVTRSNTTSKNAIEIIQRQYSNADITVHYITRTYCTRHGAGPMPNEDDDFRPNNPYPKETNQTNSWQDNLRYGPLDASMLYYAVAVDSGYHHRTNIHTKMFITCQDQHPAPNIIWPVAVKHGSAGPCREDVIQ